MTPKEKSRELVNKFTDPVRWKLGQENVTQRAKECALIAVDEILWEIIKYADNSREYVVENSLYWQEVKQEIEKI
jgi:hypothetical protein